MFDFTYEIIRCHKSLLTYPLIKEVDALIARVILISATYALISVIFITAIINIDHTEPPSHWIEIVGSFATLILLGFGFGTLNAVIYSMWKSWENVESILTRPLLFVSAVFYNPSYLPPKLIAVIKWNPIMHVIEWFREGIYADYNSQVLNREYPLICAIVLTFLGLLGERLFRKQRFKT